MAGLREQRRARTQRAIQEQAMRLFAERGFDATTVADIAAAAEVSSMTVFRYFPTKEDLVVGDEYDPAIVERVLAAPADRPLVERVAAALVGLTAEHTPDDRAVLLARLRIGLDVPALRARMWDGQYRTQRAIVDGLRAAEPDPDHELERWAATAACLAAATTAIAHWADRGGRDDLTALMDAALRVLTDPERSPT